MLPLSQTRIRRNFAALFAAAVIAATACPPAQAQTDLAYVAVEPCRVADTRIGQGYIAANTVREFRVAGSAAELASQGGTVDCLNPKTQKPVAVAAYILAVPTESSSGGGVLSAYPADQPPPPVGSGSTVNFRDAPIGNTSIVTVCSADDCPASGELAIISRNSDEHVVIDVQGYFYPSAADFTAIARAEFATITPGPPQEVITLSIDVPADGYLVLNYNGTVGISAPGGMECSLFGAFNQSALPTGVAGNPASIERVSMRATDSVAVEAGSHDITFACISNVDVDVVTSSLTATFSTRNLGAF